MKTRIARSDRQKAVADKAMPRKQTEKDIVALPDQHSTLLSPSAIDGSPSVAAQRLQIESAFGEAIQRQSLEEEEEEPLQGKFAAGSAPVVQQKPSPNRTGLPDELKAGVENLSGLSLDDVRVHYNSSRPAELQALAYTQGTDIHVAPGQERHVPHEAWHAVQQMQGRVKPTMQLKEGIPVNDDEGLEREADAMGRKASS